MIEKRLLDYERVKARAKLAETEKILSGVLYERGVDNKGFAIIRSKGDKALFHLDTKLLKRKYNTPDSRPLADFLPTISIKAKDLAAEMTSVNVQQKNLYGQDPIEKEHIDNNTAVRDIYACRTWNISRTTSSSRRCQKGRATSSQRRQEVNRKEINQTQDYS